MSSLNFVEVSRMEMQYKVFKNLQNSSFKGCAIDTEMTLNVMGAQHEQKKFHLLKKVVITFNFGIGFRRNSFISPIFRQKIMQLLTGGIWDKMMKLYKFSLKEPAKKTPPKPYDTVLTMKHLSVGFYIWLFACLLSTVAFVGEMVNFWLPKGLTMLYFKYVLGKFYKMQNSIH